MQWSFHNNKISVIDLMIFADIVDRINDVFSFHIEKDRMTDSVLKSLLRQTVWWQPVKKWTV